MRRVGFLLVALAVSRPALAQRHVTDETKARQLYEDAVQRYDLAEYDKAIEEFKQVYLMTNRPELLFNLAQSHRAKRDYETALHFYRTYLKFKPDAPNRVIVRAYIDELEKAARERDIVRPPVETPDEKPAPIVVEKPAPVVVEKPAPVVVEKPAPVVVEKRPAFFATTRGKATIALIAVSGLTLVGAAAGGGVAVSQRGQYDASCNAGACNDGFYSTGRSMAIFTDVFIAVGVAGAAVAVIVAVTRPKRPSGADKLADLAALKWRF